MDDIDQQLIGLLRDNARASLVSLAKALRVSRATVQNRISRLEANGTIVGYTVRLKPEAQAHRIRTAGSPRSARITASPRFPSTAIVVRARIRWACASGLSRTV